MGVYFRFLAVESKGVTPQKNPVLLLDTPHGFWYTNTVMRKKNYSRMTDFIVSAHTESGDRVFWVLAMDEDEARAEVVQTYTQPNLGRFAEPFCVRVRKVIAYQGFVR